MGLACGDSLEVVGWTFLNPLCMMWGIVLKWSFRSMYSVGIVLSKRFFWSIIVLVGQKDSLVAEVMGWFVGRIHWNLQFRRPPQDWEQEALDRFMGLVYSSTVWGFGPDKVCWKPTRSSVFEVRGFYCSFYPLTLVSFPWRLILQLKVPPRVAFFAWFASLGKILATDNLCKRCVLVLDWCYV